MSGCAVGQRPLAGCSSNDAKTRADSGARQYTPSRLLLRSNCGVPRLDLPDSRLCMMGIHANPVIPHGDTIAGLKYVARRFVADCARAERIRHRRFPSRLRMQLSLAGGSVEAIRRVRRAEQLA